ncbi:hypothetical protein FA13DRAFT_712282 [Coprinellus micaceus]|uniref:Uncharacterized protein n=1 Tax=Coprinellus micaceus TaxID=71717 RepID=A0A4Y7TUT1_COPMI|nr:hypothetical protein FA13DRAFT_712282 [Coprinellus micaceus]
MSLLTSEAWPVGLLNIFEHNRDNHSTFENRYRGPYDKLLNYCFGDGFTFYVGLHNPPVESRDSVDSDTLVLFVVFHKKSDSPVFFLEVKDDTWAQKAAFRLRADHQMRSRYGFMLSECPLPRLWGISVLGNSMWTYCGDKEAFSVDPKATPHPRASSRVLPPAYLDGEWE